MRTRITIILVAANLLLAGAIAYLHYSEHPDRRLREQTGKVFGPEATNLDFLEIALGDEEPRVLRLESDKWNLKSPIQWPANSFAVNRILQQIEFLEKETSFRTSDLSRTGQTLDQYGLEEPRAVLVFGRGSQRHEVRIGSPTDIGNRLYILDPSGEWIHVVNRDFGKSLSLDLDELQSATIFRIPLFEVRSLNIRLGSHSQARLARSDSEWAFETPFQTGADRKAVEAVINRLNGLRISRFVRSSPDAGDYGLKNPAIQITLDGNSRRETLLVGDAVPAEKAGDEKERYAKLAENPTVFTVQAEPLEALENAQNLLRDRKLIEFSRDRVSSIKVGVSGGEEVVLQKLETDQWQTVSRHADQSVRILPADTAFVERLLESLDEAYVLDFENDAPSDGDLNRYGFNTPQRTITLDEDTTLLLGNHVPDSDGNTLFAKLTTSRFVYTVDASILREAPARTDYFRDRLLLPQPDGAIITAVRIRDLDTGNLLLDGSLPSPDVSWQDAVADFPETEREALLALVPELRNLRVERYLADEFSRTIEVDGEEIPFAYALEADLLLVGGESPRRSNLEVLLTDRLGGQSLLGGSRQLNVVFSARQSLIDALAPLLFDRPTKEEPDDVTASNQK